MRTLQLYGSGTATASAVAQVIIPVSTRIKGVIIAAFLDTTDDNDFARWELSKAAATQITINGALDPFWNGGLYSNLLTSGLVHSGLNGFFPLDVECRQGEIVYLHAFTGGACQYYFNAIFHY